MFRLLVAFMLFCGFVFGAVNLNTANKKELMTLDGIGSKKADAIIEYRNKQPFKSIDEIKKVNGIGDKLFEKIKGEITIDGNTSTGTNKPQK